MSDTKIHKFHCDVSAIELPSSFTYPMHYTPHELSKLAAREVMDYALNQEQWRDELMAGKMLGVLVVKDHDGSLGYLAAYSGNLAHTGEHPYFVPHIYNLLEPQGLFRTGEAKITEINHRIKALEDSPEIKKIEGLLSDTLAKHKNEELQMRQAMETAKAERDKLRSNSDISAEQEAALIKESQFMKAEMRRLKKRHTIELDNITQRLNNLQASINELKTKRKVMSEDLQQQLFRLFVVHNAQGESLNIATIFKRRLHRLPPGGTGDCCAPKLLQYAFLHDLTPVCMAEFWVGQSPQGEVRHHGHFYPACRSKCLPLMEFMLQGLNVEDNPLIATHNDDEVKIIYEDDFLLVVDKPSGMLTVPGKDEEAISLLEIVKNMLPKGESALEVHRLDQATSGLVVIAKTKEIQSALRQQFEQRTVSKTYLALLDGSPTEQGGIIDLPLRPNPDDRPRQIVDHKNGKQAITRYRVLENHGDRALVEFTPLTGRTHQLRVHASHPQGLNCPIVGDMLYGTAATRLYLQAQSLSFVHPKTGEMMHFSSPNDMKSAWLSC